MEGNKRKSSEMAYGGLSYDEPAEEQVKRPRTDKKQKQSSQARVDPTYGQRSAFPGLDSYSAYTEEDDDLEYGDDIEALQYLQAVRNEAAGIPTLLVAPKPVQSKSQVMDRSIYEDGTGDSRGFYSEGAYVGATMKKTSGSPEEGVLREAQAAYFESLLKRFYNLHDQLSTKPPQMVIDGLSSNHPSFMSNSREDLRSWRWRLFNTDPQPAQVAIMDKGTVFKLLRLILTNNGALGGKTPISHRLSRWIWGLLAKLPASGELMSEEVGLIRELGKRAVWLGVEMRGVDIRELYKEKDDEEDGEELVVDFDIDNGNDDDPNLAAKGNRIIGPVIPSMEEASSETLGAAEDGSVVDEDISPPVVFGSRAEALRSQRSAPQTRELTTEDIQEGGNGGTDINKDEEARIAAMKERLLASLENQDNSGHLEVDGLANAEAEAEQENSHQANLDNAKITVDMIITIAGEVYGQRDLLEFREEWE